VTDATPPPEGRGGGFNATPPGELVEGQGPSTPDARESAYLASVMFGGNTLGKSGLKHYSGVLYEEYLPQLQGSKGIKVFDEMSDDPVIGSGLLAVESLLRSVPWVVEPASQHPEDLELAAFVEECKDDMSHTWEDFISEVLSCVRYGWSYFEIIYKPRTGDAGASLDWGTSKYRDGLVGWRKFALRSQDSLYRWKLDSHGDIQGMWQFPPPTGVEDEYLGVETQRALDKEGKSDLGWSLIFLPIEKSMLFRTTSRKNSPEGRSFLRTAYRPWYYAKRMEDIEAIGLERDLSGIPLAWVPPEILMQKKSPEAQSTYQYIKDIVQRTKRDEQEGIMYPLIYDESGNKLYDIELLSTQGRRSFDTGAIVTRYNQQKAMALLADFILLGHENVGSFALSSDKTELFSVALESILDNIEDVLNRYAIPRLLKVNGIEAGAGMPQFRHGDIEKPDLANLIQYVQGLANAGAPIFPDLILENHLRGVADLPLVSPEERERIMAEQQAQQAAMGGIGEPGGGLGLGKGGGPGGPGGGPGGGMVGFPGGNDGNGPPRSGGSGGPNPGRSGGSAPGTPGPQPGGSLRKSIEAMLDRVA
jgi:hypothetical protein